MLRIAIWICLPVLFAAAPSRLLLNQDMRNEGFAAVGRLRVNATCTAFLVQPQPGSPVYAFTNGHCVLGAAGNEVASNVRVPAASSFTTHYFVDTPQRRRVVPVKAIPYATLKGLDLAIIELDATWEDLRLQPLRLAATTPRQGARVFTIGAPVNGVPQNEAWLRRSDCPVAAVVQLAEGPWKFHDALRLSCGAIFGGASGSPVLDAATGEVSAIINTSTQGQIHSSGDIPCFTNSPCELDQPNGNMILDAAYALPLAGVARCFGNGGRFDLRAPGCPLDPGTALTAANGPPTSVRPGAEWNVTVSGVPSFRYKSGPEWQTDCRTDTGYSDSRPAGRLQELMSPADGRSVLCLLAPDQPARYATFLHTAIDSNPPALNPQWTVFGEGGTYRVQFFFNVPDLSDYRYKYGPAAAIDCDNPAGYQIYRRVPILVPFDTAALIRFCVLAGDRAGNLSRPSHILLGENHPLPGGAVHSAGFEQGPLSPGTWASLFLASPVASTVPAMTVVDAVGVTRSLRPIAAGHQVNFFLPPDIAIGPAQLQFSSPVLAAIRLDVRRVSPGIFVSPDRTAWGFYQAQGASEIFGVCAGPGGCFVRPIPVPAIISLTAAGLTLAAGLPVRVWLAGTPLPADLTAGVTFSIPPDFPYRGYVPVQIEVDGVRSNIAYLHLRDEGV